MNVVLEKSILKMSVIKKTIVVGLFLIFSNFLFAEKLGNLNSHHDSDKVYSSDAYDENQFEFGGDTRAYEHFLDKGYVAKLNVDYGFNFWFPEPSRAVKYETWGIPITTFDFDVHFKQFIPDIHLTWETSFTDSENKNNERGLLIQHKKNDGLKSAYNKIKLFCGFASLFGNNDRYDYYNPWRSNTNIGVSYNRETFRIGVTPRFSGLRYRDYDGNISTLEDEKAFYQYTKFEEISIDINSNGKMILPAIISLVFLFDKDSNCSTSNFGATSLDTTIGPYVSWWQKPYSTTQIVSGGINSGKANTIYSAKFFSVGAVEKWCYAGEVFYFNNKINWGIASVMLSKDKILFDSDSQLMMQFNIEPEVGVHLPLVNHHVILSCYGSCNWGFLFGVTSNTKDDTLLDFSSFINGDLIVNANISLTLLL